jgi:hypothetical protein
MGRVRGRRRRGRCNPATKRELHKNKVMMKRCLPVFLCGVGALARKGWRRPGNTSARKTRPLIPIAMENFPLSRLSWSCSKTIKSAAGCLPTCCGKLSTCATSAACVFICVVRCGGGGGEGASTGRLPRGAGARQRTPRPQRQRRAQAAATHAHQDHRQATIDDGPSLIAADRRRRRPARRSRARPLIMSMNPIMTISGRPSGC